MYIYVHVCVFVNISKYIYIYIYTCTHTCGLAHSARAFAIVCGSLSREALQRLEQDLHHPGAGARGGGPAPFWEPWALVGLGQRMSMVFGAKVIPWCIP